MRLNADILYENINETIPAELTGYHAPGLSLRRPEFFLDSAEPMQADHLYILPGDQFPRHLKLEKGAVIICSGNAPMVQHYLDRCCLIRLKQKTDPFAIMNLVTGIFDRYDRWYEGLHQVVETTADLAEMTEATSKLFRNPIMVLDSEFRFVTRAGYGDDQQYVAFDENGPDKLSLSALNQFLSATDMNAGKLVYSWNKPATAISLFTGDASVSFSKSPDTCKLTLKGNVNGADLEFVFTMVPDRD